MTSPTIGELLVALADVDPSTPITLAMDPPLPDLAEIVDMLTQEAE